jgi:hypothetical protein
MPERENFKLLTLCELAFAELRQEVEDGADKKSEEFKELLSRTEGLIDQLSKAMNEGKTGWTIEVEPY